MGTRGLIIVRFNRRYYVCYNHYDSYLEGLGSSIVAEIPTDPEMYRAWLERTRAKYAALEKELENEVYELRDNMDCIPDGYHGFRSFIEFPSELPSLPDVDAEYTYITNLDEEILTINWGAHWKLSSIPRQNNLWLRATVNSIYYNELTISLDMCPEEHMASPALPLATVDNLIEYNHRIVVPGTNIDGARKTLLTYVLARVFTIYNSQITQFALEWDPDSFPFRELAFALVSIASGKARLHPCVPSRIRLDRCIDREWAESATKEPPIPFGTMFHRPGELPGASPAETTYWFDNVLVTLTRVPDGKSITRAVRYGLSQGRNHFQIVSLSLFKVVLAEVLLGDDGKPLVKASLPMNLSPLRMRDCTSSHPRERPEAEPEMTMRPRRGNSVLRTRSWNRMWTTPALREEFQGCAALINFFEVAGNRRAAATSPGRLPPELYEQVLNHVDHQTWINCQDVSRQIRDSCLRSFRIDHQIRIAAGPSGPTQDVNQEQLISFDAENIQSNNIVPITASRVMSGPQNDYYSWVPVVGNDLQMTMKDVMIQFKLNREVRVAVCGA